MKLSWPGASRRSDDRERSRPRAAVAALMGATMVGLSVTAVVMVPESASAATVPTVTCTTNPSIFNTGFNSSTGGQTPNGAADERWTVAGGVDGFYFGTDNPPAAPSPAVLPPAGASFTDAFAGRINTAWQPSQSGNSQWISANYVDPSNGQNQTTGHGDWYYRYQFNLASEVDTATFKLNMSWLADTSVAGVWVNNTPQSGPNLPQGANDPYHDAGFAGGSAARTSLDNSWQTGLNTILVQVKSFFPAQGFNAVVDSSALCPSFSVSKSASQPIAKQGDKITYTVQVKNTGPIAFTAAKPASFKDDLSEVTDDAKYNNDASDGATVEGDSLSWSGPLAVGETKNITYSVTVDSPTVGDHELKNAVVPGIRGTCVPVGGCITNTPVQSYTIDKKTDATSVQPGQKVGYTVTVKNTGKVDYTEKNPVAYTDDLSKVTDDATYNGDASNGAKVDGNTLSWSGGLAQGETKTFTYSFTVNKPDNGDKRLINAVVPNDLTACAPGACVTNVPSAEFSVSKKASKTTVKPGGTVTYTVTVKNTGAVDYTAARPATFADDLTGVLDDATYNRDASAGAKVDGKTLSWSGPLAVGATTKVTYSVTVNDPSTGNKKLRNVVKPGDSGACDPSATCRTVTDVTVPRTPPPPPGPAVDAGGSVSGSTQGWPWIGTGAAALAGMVALVGMALRRRSTSSGD